MLHSSTVPGHDAEYAVDGIMNCPWEKTSSASGTNPWLRIDLGRVTKVKQVHIFVSMWLMNVAIQ